jgi:hypothetical protein
VSKHLPASIDVNTEYMRMMILSGFLTKSLKPKVKTDRNRSPDFPAHLPASIDGNQNIGCYMNIMNGLLLSGFLIKSLRPKQKTDQNLTPDFSAHPPASFSGG